MQAASGRRDFLKLGAGLAASLGGTGVSAGGAASREPEGGARPMETVRVGFVGVGVKGSEHVANLLRIAGVELTAVCDIREEACDAARRMARESGRREPIAYARGECDFQRMCETEDLDLVYTATPWEWHVPVCLAAMRAGKHAATEIPAAITLDECWQLVEAAEQAGKHLAMMENVNYMREEMAILRMARSGVLGELVHAEGAYEHDTRYLKIRDHGDGLWLGEHFARRNGNLYPMHGLGPLAWYLDINRGDRLESLVSMSSKARGLGLYAQEHLPEGHPKRARGYINGDVNSSLIRTAKGVTIILKHDTDLPRPYGRQNLVQGTRGIVQRFPEFRVCLEKNSHLEGDRPEHRWEPGAGYLAEYEHPLWKRALEQSAAETAAGRGPGSITGDYLEDLRLIEALRSGVAPDFDVYDAATWSAVSPLSERSVADHGRPVEVPDFTRGRWKTNPPVRILGV